MFMRLWRLRKKLQTQRAVEQKREDLFLPFFVSLFGGIREKGGTVRRPSDRHLLLDGFGAGAYAPDASAFVKKRDLRRIGRPMWV